MQGGYLASSYATRPYENSGGTPLYIGPPAKPIPKQIPDAIGTALGKIVEIEQAHLPMVYIKEHIDPPGPSPCRRSRRACFEAAGANRGNARSRFAVRFPDGHDGIAPRRYEPSDN